MRRPLRPRSARAAGFTLLEVMVALGVLAIGATAAFGLLVAAASTGRRAEHEVQAALIAENAFNDLQRDMVSVQLDALDDLPLAGSPEAPLPDPTLRPAAETRYLLHHSRPEQYPAWMRAFPGYSLDVTITPLEGPVPDQAWQYLVEVDVRWSERGKRRGTTFATILLRGFTHLENPAPPPPTR